LTTKFNSSLQVKFQLVAAILSVALNVMLAILLVGRLIWLSQKYRQAFGMSSKFSIYVSPAAMIVESAALYTVPQLVANVMNFISQASQGYMIPFALANVTVVSSDSITIRTTY
jgi:hypothetical protein